MKINNKLLTRDYIHGELSDSQSFSNSYTTIKYNTTSQQGRGLELKDGVITVKDSSIKMLLITQSLRTNDWSSTTIYISCLKNGVEQFVNIQGAANERVTDIIPVQKNDTVELKCYCAAQKTMPKDSKYCYINILGI